MRITSLALPMTREVSLALTWAGIFACAFALMLTIFSANAWTLNDLGRGDAGRETAGRAQTIIAGLQHVVAMFGATVLAPILMGFDPNVAILFSGIATLLFFVVTGGRAAELSRLVLRLHRRGAGRHRLQGRRAEPRTSRVALGGIIFCGASMR
jgi:putative pyrimidine permease RutG